LSDTDVDDLVAFLVSLNGTPPAADLVTCPTQVPAASCGCCVGGP
jgi:hypothetical protein